MKYHSFKFTYLPRVISELFQLFWVGIPSLKMNRKTKTFNTFFVPKGSLRSENTWGMHLNRALDNCFFFRNGYIYIWYTWWQKRVWVPVVWNSRIRSWVCIECGFLGPTRREEDPCWIHLWLGEFHGNVTQPKPPNCIRNFETEFPSYFREVEVGQIQFCVSHSLCSQTC